MIEWQQLRHRLQGQDVEAERVFQKYDFLWGTQIGSTVLLRYWTTVGDATALTSIVFPDSDAAAAWLAEHR